MRFVILTQYYPPEVGGAQGLLSSFAAELKKQGHDVRVVTALPNYPTGKIFPGYRGRLIYREMLNDIPVFRTWVFAVQTASLLPRLLNYFSFCLSCLLSWSWMEKPDILFVESPPLFLAFVARWIAYFKGARWVMNVADLWPDAIAESGKVNAGFLIDLARRLELYLYKTADFVCTVTDGIHKILIEKKTVPREKILFLPNCVDTQLFQPRAADQSLLAQHNLSGKHIFLYAGVIGLAQGLNLLLEAAALLRERSDIAIVLLGDGPVKSSLKAERDRRGLTNVVFLDPVPMSEMPRWYSISRAALVTLTDQVVHKSARPSKVLPPMACGIPVLYSGSGEMADIISHARAGLVVPPEQVQPFVDCILALSDDLDLANRLGENGRKLCEQEFHLPRVIRQWLRDMTSRTSFTSWQSSEV